jgi:hypothetical protein
LSTHTKCDLREDILKGTSLTKNAQYQIEITNKLQTSKKKMQCGYTRESAYSGVACMVRFENNLLG